MHNDLHDHNLLAADREPWLVIDPQPMSGDPALGACAAAVEPLGGDRGRAGGSAPTSTTGSSAIVDTAGLDEDRARAWVVVRMVLNAYWTIEDAERYARALTSGRPRLDHPVHHRGESRRTMTAEQA